MYTVCVYLGQDKCVLQACEATVFIQAGKT